MPDGMIEIPSGRLTLKFSFLPSDAVDGPSFFIDRSDVTNAEFQEFVDAGGYRKREYLTFRNAGVGKARNEAPRALPHLGYGQKGGNSADESLTTLGG